MVMLPKALKRGGEQKTVRGYLRPADGHHIDQSGVAAPPAVDAKIGWLQAFVEDPKFPCVGAKSAFARKTYRIGLHGRMGSQAASASLLRHLYQFIRDQDSDTGPLPSLFITYIAIFNTPHVMSETHAHELTWDQLLKLHLLDAKLYRCAPDVSSDPASPDFGFSVGGKAFFVVGLNPCASRIARRFAHPALVFNPHWQFDELRRRNEFDRLRTIIRSRDQILQGRTNPNLDTFHQKTEAFQYSGLYITDKNLCSFDKYFEKFQKK